MLDRRIVYVLSVLIVLLVVCFHVEENKEIETVQEEDTGSYIPRQEIKNEQVNVEKNESIIHEIEQPQEKVVEVVACDDTIPYGAYISYSEANVTAQNVLRQAAIEQGWFSSHYGVDTHQTECGTIYYTYWYKEFVTD